MARQLLALVLAFVGQGVFAKVPYAYRQLDLAEGGRLLKHVVIEKNRVKFVVPTNESISFYSGDELRILDPVLVDGTSEVEFVNVIGFRGKKVSGHKEDREYLIDTAKELTSSTWLYKNKYFQVAVVTGGVIHGVVLLERKNPELEQVVFSINGSPKSARDGEALLIGSEDSFRIDTIKTNLGGTNQIYLGKEIIEGSEHLTISYRNHRFAKFPLQVIHADARPEIGVYQRQ